MSTRGTVTMRSFLLSVKEKFLCLRYVDNRIVLIDKQLVHHPSFQHFLHGDFYQPPVQLEAVNTPGVQCEFLGFDIQISPTYAVEMIMTKDRWRFRLPSSLQSGFRSPGRRTFGNTFGLLVDEIFSWFSWRVFSIIFMGLNKLIGSEQSFQLHSRFGRSLVSFASMSGNFNSAMEPLLALDRWIRYTQR